ncbi:hypothetical protein [Prevotella sp. 10(H)]|uniref:hypothetical protein n=1 Tax=Prevotella sp. 10(H) TaxID=1158294 RepID=UPI0004A6BA89|nr:hypothetical protein [Prevotella sp. 10(H)]
MDLDNIKKTWQETDIKPVINDEKIQKMISNEGHSSLGKLLRYEKLGLFLIIPCSLILILAWNIHFTLFVMLACILVSGFIWQVYKLNFLKKLNVVNMNILEISSHVNKYKIYINREIIVGVIVIFIFFASYSYLTIDTDDSSVSVMTIVAIKFFAAVILCITVTLILYKYMYTKNIKKLEASIKEIKEFEKDNQ